MIRRFNMLYAPDGESGGGGGGGSDAGNAGAGAGAAEGGKGGTVGSLLSGANGGGSGGAAGSDAGGSSAQADGAAKGAWGGLIQEDGTFADAFWDKDPDLKEHGKHVSKFKTVKDVLTANINLQGLLGSKADAVIIPGPDSPPEVIAKFREKLGVPENPAGYGLKKPDNLPAGVEWDDGRVQNFAKLAHDLSLTPQQVAKLQEWDLQEIVGRVGGTEAKMIEIEKAEMAKQSKALSDAWGNGADFTKRKELATRAAITAGFTSEQLGLVEGVDPDPIFRNASVVKAFANLGALMSEDTLAKGAENGGYNDGYATSMDIINNKQNPYYERYHRGDEDIRAMVQRGLKAKK